MRRLWPLAVLAATLAVYIATLPPDVLPGDSGELIAASHTLSIAHPPGYPLYLMLGKVFGSAAAIGSVAYRYNLMSAVLASLTSAVVFLIMTGLGVRRPLGLCVTLGLATLGSFWLEATSAEVYTLNALFTALLLYLALLARRYGQRAVLLLALVGGLGLSHHLSLVYSLAAASAMLVFASRVLPTARTALVSVFLLLVGLSVWLYIPIRSSQGPPLVWGETGTLDGFLAHISAQGYQWRLRAFELGPRLADVLGFFRTTVGSCGLPLTLLACLGIVVNARRQPAVWGLVLLVGLFAFHYAAYNIPDIASHILPSFLAVGVLAGLGLESAYGLARRAGVAKRVALWVAAGAAFALPLWHLVTLEPRRDEWFAIDYARAIQASAVDARGKDCLVITSGDIASFPLFYASFTGPSDVKVYDIGISSPATIGARERPKTLDEAAARAAAMLGASKVAMFGAAPPAVAGLPTSVSGMVYVVGESPAPKSPLDYPVRGAGSDLRDYYSRLLSGSYFLHLARWCLASGDQAGARNYVSRAVEAARDDVGTHVFASRLEAGMGNADEAIALARRAVETGPDFFEAHDMLANLLFARGDLARAIEEYRLALKGNPNPAPVYSNLGNAHLSRGDGEAAAASFRQALALDSTLVNAHLGLGRGLEAAGNFAEALQHFRAARGQDSASEPALHAEASLLLRMGRSDDARRTIAEGLGLRPQSALLLSDLGLLYLRAGKPDSAAAGLERALAIDPSMLSARGNLALAYEAQGMTRDAVRQYEIYLESAPPGPLRQRVEEALVRLRTPSGD
jgi:tetratricopeptide (TPR) repeat protein